MLCLDKHDGVGKRRLILLVRFFYLLFKRNIQEKFMWVIYMEDAENLNLVMLIEYSSPVKAMNSWNVQ